MKRVLKWLIIFMAFCVVAAGGFVAATWAPDRTVEELKATWAPPPSQFIQVKGMEVHLRDEGPRADAVPIVLLHGTSASLHTWDGWVEALKGSHRVIRFDMPGFGLTGPAPDNDYRIEAYVDFVIQVLDAIGVQKVILGGNSLGGRIAWRTAAAHPGRVAKLILVDASGYPLQPESMPIGFRIAQVPVLNRLMEVTLPRSFVESSVYDVYGNPSRVTPELVDRYYDLTLREGNRAALRERFQQVGSVGRLELIRTIRQPTLILWGKRDRLLPPSNADRFAHDIGGSQRVLFEDLGHVPHEEDPAATVAAVVRFLGGPAASPAG